MARRPHSYDLPRPSSIDTVVEALDQQGVLPIEHPQQEPQEPCSAVIYPQRRHFGKPIYPMECAGRIIKGSEELVERLKGDLRSSSIIVHENKLVLAGFKLSGAYKQLEATSDVVQRAKTAYPHLSASIKVGITDLKPVRSRGRSGKEIAFMLDDDGQDAVRRDYDDLTEVAGQETTSLLAKRIVVGACANSFEAAEFVGDIKGLLPARVTLSEVQHFVVGWHASPRNSL